MPLMILRIVDSSGEYLLESLALDPDGLDFSISGSVLLDVLSPYIYLAWQAELSDGAVETVLVRRAIIGSETT